MNEVWRDAVGFEGRYQVSSLGQVRSVSHEVRTEKGDVRHYKSKILAQAADKNGYRNVKIARSGEPQRTQNVHVLVARAFHGEAAPGQEVRHLDGEPGNNMAANLKWGTHGQNADDMIAHGRHFNVNKTVCPRGHLLQIPNLKKSALLTGRRNCLACHRAMANLRNHPHLDLQEESDRIYASFGTTA